MVQPQNIPREKFPESPSFSEGMITISPRCDNHEMNYIRDIKYIERAEAELYIQLLLPDDITKRTPLLIYVTGSAFH